MIRKFRPKVSGEIRLDKCHIFHQKKFVVNGKLPPGQLLPGLLPRRKTQPGKSPPERLSPKQLPTGQLPPMAISVSKTST